MGLGSTVAKTGNHEHKRLSFTKTMVIGPTLGLKISRTRDLPLSPLILISLCIATFTTDTKVSPNRTKTVILPRSSPKLGWIHFDKQRCGSLQVDAQAYCQMPFRGAFCASRTIEVLSTFARIFPYPNNGPEARHEQMNRGTLLGAGADLAQA